MAPHMAAELWERRHGEGAHVHDQAWPSFDPDLAQAETATMVVQVNGKVRDRIEVPPDVGEERMRELALGSAKVQEHLGGQTPRRVICVPPNLVNLVG